MEPGTILNLAGNLSAVGFVIWLAHRLTTKTIPDLSTSFVQASERQRKAFTETLQAQRQDFASFHDREHTAHEARLQAVMDKCLANVGKDQ